ncbi:MAG: hypothetical protein HYS33_03695, partial [Acidobacteria bacterium]|nr:hypothetical protein [Acidobacteriota bacterium]
GTEREFLDPRFQCRLAQELLAEIAVRFELHLAQEFDEMYRCWNTGQPYGETFHPDYVAKGRRRMEIYRVISSSGDLAI